MNLGTGAVTAFDDHVGLGSVRADDGQELHFHCTRIAGGSRSIAVGARVTFAVVAGHRGRWEAADLVTH
ncbi:MAG: cold shock domain-containing protein [Actinomycetota bacterium]|nr:cold shock domain-containing protein [Actinomycetota bacterium]